MKSLENKISENSNYYLYTPSLVGKNLFFYPICVGNFFYEAGYSLTRNNYNSFLLMYIVEGSCTITVDNEDIVAQKGSVVFLDCHTPHRYSTIEKCNALWIHFDGFKSLEYYNYITQNFSNVIVPRNKETVQSNLIKIYNTFEKGGAIVEASMSKYITTILTELFLSFATATIADNTQKSLAPVITFINEHFKEQISIEELAKKASLSPFYFSRVFTKETGMTPHQYIIEARINCSKFLLKSTSLSIKEIGFKSGFASESVFCTAFKKAENITPSQYRLLDNE